MSKIMQFFPKKLRPRDVQKNTLMALEKAWNTADIFVVNLPVACHKVGQKVLKYDGTLDRIENIKIGDRLMGPDSGPRTVEKVHAGEADLYTIVPKRGQEWTVTGNHVLRLRRYVRPMQGGKRQGQFIHEEITVEEYLKKSKDYKNNSFMQRVGIDREANTNLKIPSYILGLWLGDGTSVSPALTSMDAEIIAPWKEWGQRLGCYIREERKKDNRAATYNITRGKGQSNPALDLLREVGVHNNKHIPHSYLTGSRTQRLELLAGLIDTDGHVEQKKASIEIIQVNKRLADDILYLARSLGYSASQHVKIIKGKEYYRCHISGQTVSEIPTRLPYKKPKDSKSNQNNYKFDIIPAGRGKFAGVTVDKDSLYLLDDFTISHNSGKSALSVTLAHWVKKASIIAPSKLLVDQYKDEYPYIHVLRAKADYYCDRLQRPLNKRPTTQKRKLCRPDQGCDGCKQYLSDLRRARTYPYLLSNFYLYLAQKLYRDTLIIDEAHTLIDMLKDMATKKVWHFHHRFPSEWAKLPAAQQRTQIKAWVNQLPEADFHRNWTQKGEPSYKEQTALQFLREELNSNQPRYQISIDHDMYNGEEWPCIKLRPLDISGEPPIMWPSQVKKVVLLSATIGRSDIEQLGLSHKKIKYIEADSPIHADRRPVYIPNGFNMAYAVQDKNIPAMAEYILWLAEERADSKGFIHATYGLAKKLRPYLEKSPRFMFHGKTDKAAKYREFRDAEEPRILVASGMYEGIDLKYDSARWQVIAKVPWPSLADPATKYLCDNSDTFYAWETTKTLLQACGRVCRSLDDYGETIILDSTFKRLYRQNPDMYPKWFKNSVHFIEEEE